MYIFVNFVKKEPSRKFVSFWSFFTKLWYYEVHKKFGDLGVILEVEGSVRQRYKRALFL